MEPPDLVTRTRPGQPCAPVVVLLHGSGQDETSLLAFARGACPGHEVVGVRGRIPWEGGFAFFRRHPDRALDDGDLRLGAEALRRLLRRLHHDRGQRPVLLGYSNGAIVSAAVLALDPGQVRASILLRPLAPHPDRDFPPLDGHPVLLVSAAFDRRRDPGDGPRLAGLAA